jgi:hypothetical protein
LLIYSFRCESNKVVKSTLSLASSIVISLSVELEGKTLLETLSLVSLEAPSLDKPSAGLSLEIPSIDDPSEGLSLEAPSSGILSLSVLSLDILLYQIM